MDMVNYDLYRRPTPYDGIYEYHAPEGMHWQCGGDNFGTIIYGWWNLQNNYTLEA